MLSKFPKKQYKNKKWCRYYLKKKRNNIPPRHVQYYKLSWKTRTKQSQGTWNDWNAKEPCFSHFYSISTSLLLIYLKEIRALSNKKKFPQKHILKNQGQKSQRHFVDRKHTRIQIKSFEIQNGLFLIIPLGYHRHNVLLHIDPFLHCAHMCNCDIKL